jgi:hypothetical protein
MKYNMPEIACQPKSLIFSIYREEQKRNAYQAYNEP